MDGGGGIQLLCTNLFFFFFSFTEFDIYRVEVFDVQQF